MSNPNHYDAIVSADLHVAPALSNPPMVKVVVVLYDSSDMLPSQDSLLHKLDKIGHVVIAPHHPDRPIRRGFSRRAFFYPSTNPYGRIDSTYWERALDHAERHSARRGVYRFVIVGNPTVLTGFSLNHMLFSLREQLHTSCGVLIEAFRDDELNESYHSVVQRYEAAIEQVSSRWLVSHINGMFTWLNILEEDSIIEGAVQRLLLSGHLSATDALAGRFLRLRAERMLHVWFRRQQDAFRNGERIFLTFGTEGRAWERVLAADSDAERDDLVTETESSIPTL